MSKKNDALTEYTVVTETPCATVKRTYLVMAHDQDEAENIALGRSDSFQTITLLECDSEDYDGEDIAS